MKTYSRSVLIRFDGYFNTSQYLGKLAEGLYLLPLGDKGKTELKKHIDFPDAGNKIAIWVDYGLLAHRANREKNNEYYHLIQKLNIFCKIYMAAHCGVMRPSQYKYTYIEGEVKNEKLSSLATEWYKFSEIYEKYKLLFRLYGISTIENSDYIFNIMNSAVALEGILLQGEKAENAYKFRVRGSFLLGKTYRTRTKYYNILKYAYNMRSAIVHANDKEKTNIRNKIKAEIKMSMKEFNETLINMNQILLRQLIDNPHIYDDLDDLILKG